MPEQDGTQAAKDWLEKPIVWDLLDDGDAKYPAIFRDCAISPQRRASAAQRRLNFRNVLHHIRYGSYLDRLASGPDANIVNMNMQRLLDDKSHHFGHIPWL